MRDKNEDGSEDETDAFRCAPPRARAFKPAAGLAATSGALRGVRTCPVSTGGETRRVQLVRDGGGAARDRHPRGHEVVEQRPSEVLRHRPAHARHLQRPGSWRAHRAGPGRIERAARGGGAGLACAAVHASLFLLEGICSLKGARGGAPPFPPPPFPVLTGQVSSLPSY